ncbi:MAG: hypothetical protein AAF514_22500, partial [Verrucomicrobiota bacterium]
RWRKSLSEVANGIPYVVKGLLLLAGSCLLFACEKRVADPEAEKLLSIEDKHEFATALFNRLLEQEPNRTPDQEKFYLGYKVLLDHDNGGLTGVLYNGPEDNDRETWCRKVAGSCRELGAEQSARIFSDIAPLFSIPESGETPTWGEYLQKVDPEGKLDPFYSTYDPYDDLFGALVSFADENRKALLQARPG